MKTRSLGLLLIALALVCCKGQDPPKVAPAASPLIILTSTEPTSFDPQIPFDESDYVLGNIYEPLVRFDSSFRLSPGLAQRWTNPDDRTWRFYLDPNAKFSNGQALTSADVKFSIERLQKLTGSDRLGFTENIASIVIVDEHTLDIKTDTAQIILNNLVYIPILCEKQLAAGQKSALLGTGPFRIKLYQKGDRIILDQNPYHIPKPAISEVDFILSSNQEHVIDDMQRVKPDLTLALPFRKIEQFQALKRENRIQGQQIVSAKGISVYYLIFNLKNSIPDFAKNPLTDIRLRKALALATDRNELVKKVLKGFGRPATQLIAPEIFGYDPKNSAPEYNPEEGKKLIENAGYTGLKIPIYSSLSGSNIMYKTLIEQWAKIGIQAESRQITDEALSKGLANGVFSVTVTGYSCGSGDASEFLTFGLHSRDGDMRYGKGNYAFYSNQEVDRMCSENLRIFDPRERLEMLQNALRVVSDDLPYLPLMILNDVYVVSDRLQWQPAVNGEINIADMSFR